MWPEADASAHHTPKPMATFFCDRQREYLAQLSKGKTEQMTVDARAVDKASHAELNKLRALPCNAECFDCTAKKPGWAVLPWGCYVCIDCAQVHRNLGRHISQTKAINTGTYLWYPHELAVMREIGNARAAKALAGGPAKPSRDAPRSEKDAYARDKYEARRWGPGFTAVAREAPPTPAVPASPPAPAAEAQTPPTASELVNVWVQSNAPKPAEVVPPAAEAPTPADVDLICLEANGLASAAPAAVYKLPPQYSARIEAPPPSTAWKQKAADVMSKFELRLPSAYPSDMMRKHAAGRTPIPACGGSTDFFARYGL